MTTSTLPPTPQYQVQQQALRAQNRNQPQPPINRLMNGMPPRQAVQMPPNGSGMPNGMPGGQGMPNGHMSFPMSNQPGHPPSGPGNAPGGPQQPLNMQGMMPGQRPMGQFSLHFRLASFSRLIQGGVPQPQQPGQGMVQMQGNQHMGQMNRPMLPPNGPPNMANHVPGNQPQAHSPNYPQQIGRPSSRPSTPGQGVITNPSPSMAHRLPPGGPPPSINEINSELIRIPNTLLPKIKQDLGISPDKELTTMTNEERVCSYIPWFVYLLTILISIAYSHSIAESTVARSNPDQVPPNNHRTLLALLRRPLWHQRTFVTIPRPSSGRSVTARPLVRRKALLQRGHARLRVVVITRTRLVHHRTNLRWRPWLLSILSKEVAPLDHRTCKMV